MIMDNPAAPKQHQPQQQQQQQSWMESAGQTRMNPRNNDHSRFPTTSSNSNATPHNFYRTPIEEESLSHLHRKQLEILRNEQQRGMNSLMQHQQQQQQKSRTMMMNNQHMHPGQDDLFAPLSFPGFSQQQQQQQQQGYSKEAKLQSDVFSQRRGLEPHQQRLSRTGLRGDPLNDPSMDSSNNTPFGDASRAADAATTGDMDMQPKTKEPSLSRFMDNLREQSQWNDHSNEASTSSVYDALPYDASFNLHGNSNQQQQQQQQRPMDSMVRGGGFFESNSRNTPPFQQAPADPASLPPLSYGSNAMGSAGNMYNSNTHNYGMNNATSMGPMMNQQGSASYASSYNNSVPPHAQQPQQAGSAMAAAMMMDDEEEDSRFKPFHEEKWAVRYKELVHFHRENGHSAVPHTYPPNPQLARWVKRQRRQCKLLREKKASTMTQERLQLLNMIDFIWDSHEVNWREKLMSLDQFRMEHGHCNVPSNYVDKKLATWVKCQRRQYKLYWEGKGSAMCQKRIFALERRGFEWEIRHSAPKNKGGDETDDNANNAKLDDDNEAQDRKPSASDGSLNLSPTPLDESKV